MTWRFLCLRPLRRHRWRLRIHHSALRLLLGRHLPRPRYQQLMKFLHRRCRVEPSVIRLPGQDHRHPVVVLLHYLVRSGRKECVGPHAVPFLPQPSEGEHVVGGRYRRFCPGGSGLAVVVKPGRGDQAAGLPERLAECPLLRHSLAHRVHEQPLRVQEVLEPPPVSRQDVRPAVNDKHRVPGVQLRPRLAWLGVQSVRHGKLPEPDCEPVHVGNRQAVIGAHDSLSKQFWA